MIIDKMTPDEVIDMVGLHINYLIIIIIINKENVFFFTCHVKEKTYDLSLPVSVKFEKLVKTIQNAFGLTEVKKLRYKDNDGDFITVSNDYDFKIAMQIYSIGNRL